MASKVLNIIVIAIGVLAFIMCAASCGGDKWLEAKNTDRYSGIWRACVNGQCETLEYYLDLANKLRGTDEKIPDYLNAIRAFTVIACLVLPVGILFAVLSLVTEKVKILIAAILYLVGAFCMLIAMSVFTDKEEFDSDLAKYGWSYILGWIGMIIAGVGAIIGFVAGAAENTA